MKGRERVIWSISEEEDGEGGDNGFDIDES